MYEIALKKAPAIDMIMFGRMVASDPSLNYDATVQVHIVSQLTPFINELIIYGYR